MTLFSSLSDVFFPRECVLCGRAGSWLCAGCAAGIPLVLPTCPICQRRTTGGMAHRECAHSFSLEGCLAAASLSLAPVQRLIYGCKYHGLTSAAHALAMLMARAIEGSPALDAFVRTRKPAVVPIPLHPQKERERGFNQSARIAQSLTHFFPLPLRHLLIRTKPTADQVKLTRAQRRENLTGAFSVAQESAHNLPQAVLLIDDVVTTGATFDAAARALRNAHHTIAIWGLTAAYHATADAIPLHI